MVLPSVEALAVHELSITRNIVEIARTHAEGRRVLRVRLAVGALSAVLPDAMRACFDVVTENTPLAGARLEIEEISGLARCLACGADFALPSTGAHCSCGQMDFRLLAGQELKITELELSEGD